VFDITFTLEFPRELVLFGSLRSEIQTFNPPEGGALLLLTGENGEILRRQVGTVTETLDLSHTEFLEPGTYRLLVRAHRGGGRRFVERLGVGRSSFDVHADFRARPLVLEVSPLVRGEEATFSVRDADPDIEVKVFATMNGTCVPLFCNPGIPLNPPIVTVGAGMADASGSIDFRVRIPRGTSAALIHSVAFQTRTGPTGIPCPPHLCSGGRLGRRASLSVSSSSLPASSVSNRAPRPWRRLPSPSPFVPVGTGNKCAWHLSYL
jgi:hypothetical protein